MKDGALGAAGDEDGVRGVPGDGADLLFVAFEEVEFLHGADVEDADGLVARGGGDLVAIR